MVGVSRATYFPAQVATIMKQLKTVDNKFAWDNYRKSLFGFNLDKTGEFVFGLQTRQMDDPNAKYKTYTIEKIHEWFMKSSVGMLDYASKYNHLSTLTSYMSSCLKLIALLI